MYVNPIEILGLSNATDTTSIDNEIVRKAKRKLFADIDLSDNGVFEYYGLQLTKGNCEKAIDELTNNDYKEFYLYLANNKPLNEFLANGNETIFSNFKQDSIFKLPEFLKFISPYFALKFDKALLMAFENKNPDRLKAILKTSILITQADLNSAFKSVSNSIQNKIAETSEIKEDIKNEESPLDDEDIDKVVELVLEYFPSDILNSLPNYFQSQILKIANEINNLMFVIWENFENTQACNDLLEHILTLNVEGLNKPTFQKNYEIVKKKNLERIEQESNTPTLKKYAEYLIQSRVKIKEIENKTINPLSLLNWVNSTISISELNSLSNVFDEIKNQVALSLRAMSIEVWNTFSRIEVSISFIDKANNIRGLKPETQLNIQEAKKQLTELKNKIDAPNLARQRSSSTQTSKQKDGNLLNIIWALVVIIIILFIYAIDKIKSNNRSSVNYPTATDSYTAPAKAPDYSPSTNNSESETKNKYSPPVISHYKGNQLKDGASPLTGCFGKGIYSGNATLTIKNGGNSDAIICLYSIAVDRTIRNEYVQKNSSFTMSNIAQGDYKIRVFYGNDWNPDLENSCGSKGNFESDVNFSEFDGIQYFEDSEWGYTNATVTLYTVAGGNASSSSIDKSKFFKK